MQASRLPEELALEFERVRGRTEWIFDRVAPEAFYERPIPLRHPIVFYAGHLDAFNDTRLQRHWGLASTHPALDALFERGIDPSDTAAAARHAVSAWPSREQVRAYTRPLRDRLFAQLERLDPQATDDVQLFHLLLEHELMHQETLLYMLHQLPYELKRPPDGLSGVAEGPLPPMGMVAIPEGMAVLGQAPGEFAFGWDNEFPRHAVRVPGFAIDRTDVTNGQYLAFIEEGGYRRREFWSDRAWAWKEERGLAHPFYWRQVENHWRLRGLFAESELPVTHPVYVTHAEAAAYARYAGKELPSEAEWHRAAYGDGLGPYPWGAAAPGAEHGNFDFRAWGTVPAGTFPQGASSYGVLDLVGNGWEWTRTPFGPFEGFVASTVYPPYSTDFFDGEHFVLKGASCVTDRRLIRRSLRNWFYWHYPYMYATFRCVSR
ncbi:MAG TPA: SUMF1/EgtB/PvdO family nonheme iron enzyme [Stenomitos sp.]